MPRSKWIVITSTYHMPGAIAVMQKQDWSAAPYPVDYRTEGVNGRLLFTTTGGEALQLTDLAMKEWIGLLAYYFDRQVCNLVSSSKGGSRAMIEGSCHCGTIRFKLANTPKHLTDCNCTFCRRSGALWAHDAVDQITVTYNQKAVIRYSWDPRNLAVISCKTCGGTTHWESLDPVARPWMAVNCNMVDPASITNIRVRRFDGAERWEYLD